MPEVTSSWPTILSSNPGCLTRISKRRAAPLYDLALANGQLVATLNQTKASLLTRLRGDRGQRGTRRTLHYYFAAQDIHERASSSHVQYAALREVSLQRRYVPLPASAFHAVPCVPAAGALHLLRTPYQHDPRFERVFSHLDAAIDRVRASGTSPEHIKALGFLLNNLRAIDAQLATIESEQAMALPGNEADSQLADDSVHSFSDMWLRLSRNFTPESALFRHAVRMSLVLCVGYAFIQITGLHHGYWILLTSLFVCQPNYNATRHRRLCVLSARWWGRNRATGALFCTLGGRPADPHRNHRGAVLRLS